MSKTEEKIELTVQEKKPVKSEIESPRAKKEIAKPKKQEGAQEQWIPGGVVGQLSVDVYDAGDSLVLVSTAAGINSEDIDVTVEPDLITIRGERKCEEKNAKNYFHQECFWGKFSRTLVLPVPVRPDGVRANIKNGILTIYLAKAKEREKTVRVK